MLKYFNTDINYYSYTSIPVTIVSSISSVETLQKEEMFDIETSVYKRNMKDLCILDKQNKKKKLKKDKLLDYNLLFELNQDR